MYYIHYLLQFTQPEWYDRILEKMMNKEILICQFVLLVMNYEE